MSSIIFAEDRIRLGKLRVSSRFLLDFHYLCKRSEAVRQSSRASPARLLSPFPVLEKRNRRIYAATNHPELDRPTARLHRNLCGQRPRHRPMGHPGHHRRHRRRAGLPDPPAVVAGRATRRQADQSHVGRHHLRRQSPAAAVPHRHPDPGGGDAAHRLSRSKRPRRPDHAAGTDSDRHRRPALRQFPAGSHISTDGPPGGVERASR